MPVTLGLLLVLACSDLVEVDLLHCHLLEQWFQFVVYWIVVRGPIDGSRPRHAGIHEPRPRFPVADPRLLE